MTGSRRSWLVTGLLWVIAVVAVAVAAPAGIARRSAPGPAAPGLAALSNAQLARLLPGQDDFPTGWTIEPYTRHGDNFGYWAYQRSDELGKVTPSECADMEYGATADASLAVEVAGDAPTGTAASRDPGDVRLRIGREFRPAGFDEMIALVSRCGRFSHGSGIFRTGETAQILEDSRPAAGPQIFRYSVTTDFGGPDHHTTVRYYSYARLARLILSGDSIDDDRQVFDTLFARSLARIRAAAG